MLACCKLSGASVVGRRGRSEGLVMGLSFLVKGGLIRRRGAQWSDSPKPEQTPSHNQPEGQEIVAHCGSGWRLRCATKDTAELRRVHQTEERKEEEDEG
eukprot:976584-Rhodomonas_salina.1